MRKIVFIVFMLLSMGFVLKAQCNLPFKSLREFNNDTTVFYQYNFGDRKAYYVGKTVSDLVNDLGIPVVSFLPIIDNRWNDIYRGIYLFETPYHVASYRICSRIRQNYISIEFETPLNMALLDSIDLKSNWHKWTETMYNLLKDKKIKDIGIVRKR